MEYAGVLMFSPAFSLRIIGYLAVRLATHFSVAAEAKRRPAVGALRQKFSLWLPVFTGRASPTRTGSQ